MRRGDIIVRVVLLPPMAESRDVRNARRTVTVPRDRVRRKPVQAFRLQTVVPNRVRLQMVPALVPKHAHVIAKPVRRDRMHQVIVRVPKIVAVIVMVHAM